MQIRQLYYFSFIFFLFISCHSPKPTGVKYSCGYPYEWAAFQEEEDHLPPDDSIVGICFRMVAGNSAIKKRWMPDTVLWKYMTAFRDGYFKKIFCFLKAFRPGDSIHCTMPARDFFEDVCGIMRPGVEDSALLTVRFRVDRIFTIRSWKIYSDSLKMTALRNADSIGLKWHFFRDSSGIWSDKPLIPQEKNSREEEVRIDYGCRTLSGHFIDSTFEPIFIRSSDPDAADLIKGLNYVIKHISCPDTVKIILPSHMAFSEKGFFSMVPPHTPLVYCLIKRKHEKK